MSDKISNSFLDTLKTNVSEADRPMRRPFVRDDSMKLKLQPGDHFIRVLPYEYNGKYLVPPVTSKDKNGNEIIQPRWALPEYTHWNIPRSDKDETEAMLCTSSTYPEKFKNPDGTIDLCPICAALDNVRSWARDQGLDTQEIRDLFGRHRLTQRAYVNCIVRGSKETQVVEHNGSTVEIPKIWVLAMPFKTVFIPLSQSMITQNPMREYMYGENPLDPFDGYDFLIKRTGDGIETKYMTNIVNKTPLHNDPDIVDAICSNAYDLTKFVRMPDERRMDHARVLADRIRGIKSSPVKPGSSKSKFTTDPKPMFSGGSVSGDARPAGSPDCYFNHLPTNVSCSQCNLETDCSSASAAKGIPMEARRKVERHPVTSF